MKKKILEPLQFLQCVDLNKLSFIISTYCIDIFECCANDNINNEKTRINSRLILRIGKYYDLTKCIK